MPPSYSFALGAHSRPGSPPKPPALLGDNIFGSGSGLEGSDCHSEPRKAAGFQTCVTRFQLTFWIDWGLFPSSHGFHGCYGADCPSCPPAHAACLEAPAQFVPVSTWITPEQDTGFSGMLVEKQGACFGTSGLSPTGLHRCIPTS